MKLNKKKINFLLLPLTLIISTIFGVACNKKILNKNIVNNIFYKTFTKSLNKIIQNDKSNFEFSNYDLSFSTFLSNFKSSNLTLNVNKNININNLMLYDISNSINHQTAIKLSDFDYDGGILSVNNHIIFKNKKNKKLDINNILFATNFDLTFHSTKNFSTSNSVTVNQLTGFFKLTEDRKNIIKPTRWESNNINISSTPFNENFKIDHDCVFDTEDLNFDNVNLGLTETNFANEKNLIFGDNYFLFHWLSHNWNKNTIEIKNSEIFSISNDLSANIEKKSKSLNIKFKYNKTLSYFHFGNASDKYELTRNGYFFSLVDITNWKNNSNKIIVSPKNSILVYFKNEE